LGPTSRLYYTSFAAKGITEWQDDRHRGLVVGGYKDKGVLESGKSYFIISGNVRETMKVLKKIFYFPSIIKIKYQNS
jgi:hypothetical protein